MSRRRNHAAWLGPIVGLVGLISYFTVFAKFPSLRDSAWLNLLIVAVGLAVAGVGVRRAFEAGSGLGRRILGAVGFTFAFLFAALLAGYVFVLSSTVPEPTPTALGVERLPAITLTDQHGAPVDLGPERGRRILLVFYRGHW